ncbi:MAG: helix-turn-helix domain-containing protein, partial [Clostridiales bacterium]|nr:helix-turn-helix domain-containing protein [Clostridiales bacterium]
MFGENLKAVRKAKGYTQEELAIKLNVVRQTVSKWEKGLSVPDADV